MERSLFQFKNPTLDKLIYEENENFSKEEYHGLKMDSSTKIKKIDEENAIVFLELIIGDKERAPFYIDIMMKAKFTWADKMEQDVDKLLRCNAPSVLLSYIRPIVANVTSNSAYPTLNVPFINFSNNDIEGLTRVDS